MPQYNNANVLRLDDNSLGERFEFATTVDLNKCLTKIKLPISLSMCATISELPTDICTMNIAETEFCFKKITFYPKCIKIIIELIINVGFALFVISILVV